MKNRFISIALTVAIVFSCFVFFPVVTHAYGTYEVSTVFAQNVGSGHSVIYNLEVTNNSDGHQKSCKIEANGTGNNYISTPAVYDGKSASNYQYVVVVMRYEAYTNSRQNYTPEIAITTSPYVYINNNSQNGIDFRFNPSKWVELDSAYDVNGFDGSLGYSYAVCSLSELGCTGGIINQVYIRPFDEEYVRENDKCWIDKVIFVSGSEEDANTVGRQNIDFHNYIVPNYRYGVRITNGVRYNGTGGPAIRTYSSTETPELSPRDSDNLSFSPLISSGGKLIYGSDIYVDDDSYTFSWSGSVSRNYYVLKGYYVFRYLSQGLSSQRCGKYEDEAGKLTYKKWLSAGTTSASIDGEIDTYTELVLVPAWEPINYSIKYNLNGGTNHPSNPSSYNYESSSYTLQNPTRAGYRFTGWTPASSSYGTTINNSYMGERTYTANWVADNVNVTWYDENGTSVLHTDTILTGSAVPAYDGPAPTKEGNAHYSYTFSHWQPLDGVEIGGIANTSVRFKAVYSSSVNTYTVTWKNDDGTVLETDTDVAYGSTPTFDQGNPTKVGNAQYSYEFSGWSPTVSTVTGNVTYTATYVQKVNQYTVTWVDGDGNVIHVDTVDYGITPSYDGPVPTKTSTADKEYSFNGSWSPSITAVVADQVYTAQFSESVRKYTVTWVDEDGTVLEVDENVPYGTRPEYNGKTPEKAPDAQYTYSFYDWDPAVNTVTGNVTYTAVYAATVNEYEITWVDGNGNVIETDPHVPYGTTPSYDGVTPTKQNPGYFYEFIGWDPELSLVTGDMTYVAQFSETIADYTVTYVTDVGISPESLSYTINDSITVANMEQPGYIFDGWEVTTASGSWNELDLYCGGDVIEKGMYGDVVLTALWSEVEITISYVAVGEGSVSPEFNGNIGAVSGSPAGSTATAGDASKFVGWYLDEAGTILVSESESFVPTKLTDGDSESGLWTEVTYYAVFRASITDLVIAVDGSEAKDDQTYIFDVIDDRGEIVATVVSHGDEEVKVKDIAVGTYTVKEQNGWSWRYEPDEESKELTLTDKPEDNRFEFTETRQGNKDEWIDFNVFCENIFGKKENEPGDN